MAEPTSSPPPRDDEERLQRALDEMSFLSTNNSEACHMAELAEAYRLHQGVRMQAMHVLQTVVDTDAAERLKEQADLLERKIAAAERKQKEEARMREAEKRAKEIRERPPSLPTPPPQTSTTPEPPAQPQPTQTPAPVKTQSPTSTPPSADPIPSATAAHPTPSRPNVETQKQPQAAPSVPQAPTTRLNPFQPPPAPPTVPTPTLAATTQQSQKQAPQIPPAQPAPAAKPISHAIPDGPRFLEIHQNLKELRKYISQQTDMSLTIPTTVNGRSVQKQFSVKTYAGDLRRTLTRTLGQVTEGSGTNKQQLAQVQTVLNASLAVPSPPCQPGMFFVRSPTGPVEGAQHNGDTMPTLFVYLLSILAKVVVAQLASEASANPKVADPIGVLVHMIITVPNYQWRGAPFMDIIMAKFRVSLPVVFGIVGNEKSEEGRARLGWRKDDGNWISDQEHGDRMRGLGCGYAALCLRNYSKAARKNPWPPTHYWKAMAAIVSTPEADRSPTQTTVLTALIDGYETKFLGFYGDMAIAALKAAVIEYPRRSKDPNAASIRTLRVLGDRLKKDLGLALQG